MLMTVLAISSTYDSLGRVASQANATWNYSFGRGKGARNLCRLLNQMDVVAGTRQTFLPDLQGSILATLDSSTGALTTRGYLLYGASASATGSFAYAGQRLDAETKGLYYARACMYAPGPGRFLQPDPIGYEQLPQNLRRKSAEPESYQQLHGCFFWRLFCLKLCRFCL